MNWKDLLQAASNEAAGAVSAPVDALSWLLNKAGVPVGEAVGGSDWMRRQGLTRDVEQSPESLAGSTLGLLAPIVAAAKAPQIARGLLQAGDNLAAPRTLNPQTGAIVWHGSPHKFDKFDSSKIGTGEGAQAYGHGLYLAESPTVAGSYSGKLSSELKYNGRAMQRESGRNTRDSAAWALYLADGDKAAAKASGLAKPELIDALDPAKLKPGGQLYKVDLPDEKIARMLDWDKPLSQQAELLDRITPTWRGGKASTTPWSGDASQTGQQFYNEARRMVRATGIEADWLSRLGIPGIRYLDGGSRNVAQRFIAKHPMGGENVFNTADELSAFTRRNPEFAPIYPKQTSNYVVFPGEENVLKILERNGKSLP
jgi:hypothetical protein